MGLRIGLAQINSVLGDFAGNRRKIIQFAKRAAAEKCDLVVFPEMALFGYMACDLLERRAVVDAQLKEFGRLTRDFPAGLAGLVGLVSLNQGKTGKPYHNSAALLIAGKKPRVFNKQLLPNYDVFDESRHLEPGRVKDSFFSLKGKRVQVTICEDIWAWVLPAGPKEDAALARYPENPLASLGSPRPHVVVNLSASPFAVEKEQNRLSVVSQTARHFRAPVVYVNMVGGQDEIIFDGGSFAVGPNGAPFARSRQFAEDLAVVDVGSLEGRLCNALPPAEVLRQALVLGIRDFARKTGLARAHLGLSGGIDSALVACLAVEALGPEQVTGVTLPGPFNPELSLRLAQRLAGALGIRLLNAPISTTYETALEAVHGAYGDFDFGITNENLQSRIRGLFLMALANKDDSLLLTTGNKSECAVGYTTLYGDMCGGLAPIGDLLKSDVYALSRLYNATSEVIPEEILLRAPSAELRPNQTDQDSLPPYPKLDRAVRALVERQGAPRGPLERWVQEQIQRTEFKRWQSAPILKVTRHAFGRGRRMPVANGS